MKSVLVALALASVAVPATAATQLITNGGFETTNVTDSTQFGANYTSTTVEGWDAGGLTALYFPGTAERGATTQYGYRDFKIYGPANGHDNGLTETSPAGGNFVVLDGDTNPSLRGTISQTVNGLVAGKTYTLSFYLAGGQQFNFGGDTFDKYVDVTFGGVTKRSDVLGGAEASFQPWRQQTMNFKATGTSDVLTFLAHGQPNGLPPLVLIDGVSMMSAVPEPATWGMMILGFGLVGMAARRRRAVAQAAA